MHYHSTYYCYILCGIYSASLYEQKFKSDPLSFETGNSYRKLILSQGGAGTPSNLMENFLGIGKSPLNIECFTKSLAKRK